MDVDEGKPGPSINSVTNSKERVTSNSDWENNLITEEDTDELKAQLMEVPDGEAPEGSEWELFLQREAPNLTYTVWKRPWKNGLNTYKSATLMTGVTAPQLFSFQSDDALRCKWDGNVLEYVKLADEGEHKELQYWRCKYPCPMAVREYVYAKQSFYEESTGFFSISNSVESATDIEVPTRPGRSHRVSSYLTATRIFDKTDADASHPQVMLVQICQE